MIILSIYTAKMFNLNPKKKFDLDSVNELFNV